MPPPKKMSSSGQRRASSLNVASDDVLGGRKRSLSPQSKVKSAPIQKKRTHVVIGDTKDALPPASVNKSAPKKFKQVWDLIQEMRKSGDAPVDTMGCERLADERQPPAVCRYQQLVALMLSSQTKDEMTAAAVRRLQKHGLTMPKILRTPDVKLEELLYGVGFHRKKVHYLKETTRILQNEHGGDVPSDMKSLLKLPGVGPKMAHLFIQVGWGRTDGVGVDVHVHRISGRLGWVDAAKCPTPEHTRIALEEWLPYEYWRPINALFVGFGQQICKPVGPLCGQCKANKLCPAAFKTETRSPKKGRAE
uniref:Endonuclease III homolog n=1 Tax=Eutreptiella gymnastica TaxID=73025 RepID=A0A7S1NTP3_9EUGL|mmetsp:Transcript_91796/g.159212  ORF Transcript_91796/g.159212 Transcript_91796/m.159212 type:complete len:306 (+) Transcript_91796:102-1019(+)